MKFRGYDETSTRCLAACQAPVNADYYSSGIPQAFWRARLAEFWAPEGMCVRDRGQCAGVRQWNAFGGLTTVATLTSTYLPRTAFSVQVTRFMQGNLLVDCCTGLALTYNPRLTSQPRENFLFHKEWS